jgi:hypothetical protein
VDRLVGAALRGRRSRSAWRSWSSSPIGRLRRLNADALQAWPRASKPGSARTQHRGKFGSIARSVNIHVDKVAREAKAAKQDLDQLLGPASDDALAAAASLGAVDLLAAPVASRPVAPPPSEFKFSAPAPSAPTGGPPPSPPGASLAPTGPAAAPPRPAPPPAAPPVAPPAARAPAPPVPARPATPPPVRPTTPSPFQRGLEDDVLDAPEAEGPLGDTPAETAYFKEVFDQFVALKRTCGESIAGLTLAKFAGKLRKNRDDLRAKTGCVDVKFRSTSRTARPPSRPRPSKD